MAIKLKVDELKDELSKRELNTTGINPTLVKSIDPAICKDSVPVAIPNNQLQKRERESPADGDCSDDLRKLRKNKELHKQASLRGASSSRSKSNKTLLERLYKYSQTSNVEEIEGEDNIKKGLALLDEYTSDEVKSKYHILEQGNVIYDAKWNHTDVEGKDNEFYIIQALESNDGSTFMVYNRWGRVGFKGQDKLHGPYTCVQSALDEFKKNLVEKAKNYFWSRYKQFVSETKLDERIAEFISLICNASMREEQKQMMATGYDAERLPRGKPTEAMSSEVESLGETEVASELLENAYRMEEDPLFSIYQLLGCELIPIEVDSEEFHMINKYMKNTHAKTHSSYTCEIVQIFRASKHGEADNFSKFSNIENRILLWHGSRLSNWFGILSQGLRIAPPEAPATGEMFGKGLYFADIFSKSANYCHASQQAPDGVLLLSEVALGPMVELLKAEPDADKLPPGKLSTKGVGASGPDVLENETLEDGVIVPLGHPIKQLPSKVSLFYNEFVVYNANQSRMRYLVHVKFIFKEKEVAFYTL